MTLHRLVAVAALVISAAAAQPAPPPPPSKSQPEVSNYTLAAGEAGQGDRVRAGAQPAVLRRVRLGTAGAGRCADIAGGAEVSRLGGAGDAGPFPAGVSLRAGCCCWCSTLRTCRSRCATTSWR